MIDKHSFSAGDEFSHIMWSGEEAAAVIVAVADTSMIVYRWTTGGKWHYEVQPESVIIGMIEQCDSLIGE